MSVQSKLQSYLVCPLCKKRVFPDYEYFKCIDDDCPVELLKIKIFPKRKKEFEDTAAL